MGSVLFLLACLVQLTQGGKYENVTAEMPSGLRRPPGTLLLNMLIKNEAVHLTRTLPRWAKIIDYWIIGVDDANTDDSPEIIQKYLGHIPGEIVIVHFQGMGPTWSQLVQTGIEKYPEALFGVLSDADFMPMVNQLDKMELDVRCSKHMYTIWTEDHRNERKMDWVYRNIPGAVVKRRTHQILEVPELRNQEVFQTLVRLPLEEREGGYQDRTGVKNQRYIGFLEDDLLEFPNDTRTLYYLGYAHFDIFNQNHKNPQQEHWDDLTKGVEYFKKRMSLKEGNKEERWFAILKLGEIYERFYNDWPSSEKFYKACVADDPERADAYFYLGQHYRLRKQHQQAYPYLLSAAKLEVPERALFQWHYLYFCLSKIELGRAVQAGAFDRTSYKETLEVLRRADCSDGDAGNLQELAALTEAIDVKMAAAGKSTKDKLTAIKSVLSYVTKHFDTLEKALSEEAGTAADNTEDAPSLFTTMVGHLKELHALREQNREQSKEDWLSCRDFRRATTPFLRFMRSQSDILSALVKDKAVMSTLSKNTNRMRVICR